MKASSSSSRTRRAQVERVLLSRRRRRRRSSSKCCWQNPHVVVGVVGEATNKRWWWFLLCVVVVVVVVVANMIMRYSLRYNVRAILSWDWGISFFPPQTLDTDTLNPEETKLRIGIGKSLLSLWCVLVPVPRNNTTVSRCVPKKKPFSSRKSRVL